MKTVDITTVTLGTATGTLTTNNTTPTNGKVVVIGSKTYTFTTGTPSVEGQVKAETDGDTSLQNLIDAINRTSPGTKDGVKYKIAAANTQVSAGTLAAHAVTITALAAGLDGNVATTTDETTLTWGAATLLGGQAVTIVGTVSDLTFTNPTQQVTVGEFPTDNASWSRAIRLSNQALFCIRTATPKVAFLISAWTKLAVAIENTLTWTPKITTQPANAAAVHDSTSATFTVVAVSELTKTYQWQVSSNAGASYSNLTDAGIYSGTATATLTVTPVTNIAQNGYYYRCVITNGAGSTNSTAGILTVT